MTPIIVRPTRADLSVAKIISAHTGPRTERAAEFLTWGADEHILCALAARLVALLSRQECKPATRK
jgi:undecaprenyl-diphosphatase